MRFLKLSSMGLKYTPTTHLPGCPRNFASQKSHRVLNQKTNEFSDCLITIDWAPVVQTIDECQFDSKIINSMVPAHDAFGALDDKTRMLALQVIQVDLPSDVLQKLLICMAYRERNPEHPGMAPIAAYNRRLYENILDQRGDSHEVPEFTVEQAPKHIPGLPEDFVNPTWLAIQQMDAARAEGAAEGKGSRKGKKKNQVSLPTLPFVDTPVPSVSAGPVITFERVFDGPSGFSL
jgi:hypothetical protein